MVAVPAGLPVGIVAGRFLFVSQDQADADTNVDYAVVTGTVKFTCSAKKPLQVSAQNLVLVPREFYAEFDSQGYLRPVGAPVGQRDIELPASSSEVYNPSGFTWKVDFNLRDTTTGNVVKVDSFSIYVQEGVTNDIADQLPLSESKGVVMTRGAQGVGIYTVTNVSDGVIRITLENDTYRNIDLNPAIVTAVTDAMKPSGIGIDTDGVPYISPAANEAYIMYDTDGTPYFV